MIKKINVGGKIFETYAHTLDKIPYFANNDSIEMDINKFKRILDNVRFNKNSDLSDCQSELEQLGLIANNESVLINVGGNRKYYNRIQLMEIPYFKALLNDKWKQEQLFIDMDSDALDDIITSIKNNHPISNRYRKEAEYLMIDLERKTETINTTNTDLTTEGALMMLMAMGGLYSHNSSNPEISYHTYKKERITNYTPTFLTHQFTIPNPTDEFTININSVADYLCYIVFELDIDFKVNYDLIGSYDITWIDNIEAHLIEYIDISANDNRISYVTGEAILAYMKEKNIKYPPQKMNKLVVPFYNFMKDDYNGIPLINVSSGFTYKVKFRPLHKLLRYSYEGNDYPCNETIILESKIDLNVHYKMHYLDGAERSKIVRKPMEALIRQYKTIVIPIDNKNVKIKFDNIVMGVDTISLYVRNKNDLKPVKTCPIKKLELSDCGHILMKYRTEIARITNTLDYINRPSDHLYDDSIVVYKHGFFDALCPIIYPNQYNDLKLGVQLNDDYGEDDEIVCVIQGYNMYYTKNGLAGLYYRKI